ELRVAALARGLVAAPAAELRGVAEARALHVVVADLDHELRAQRLPREVLALAPAAPRAGDAPHRRPGRAGLRPALPRGRLRRAPAVGREEGDELAPRRVAEARRHADVVEGALLVVEPEQEGA